MVNWLKNKPQVNNPNPLNNNLLYSQAHILEASSLWHIISKQQSWELSGTQILYVIVAPGTLGQANSE